MELVKTGAALAKITSKDSIGIRRDDLRNAFLERKDEARTSSATADEFETKMVVISQENALAVADIHQEWMTRCFTPAMARRELAKVTTLSDSIELMSPSMGVIKRIKDRKYVLAYIKKWIVDLQHNLNLKYSLTEDMIDLAAETILTQYSSLTIADIKNVFTNALNGVYGEFYERIAIPKLISWIDEYFNQRCELFASKSEDENYFRKRESGGFTYEDAKIEAMRHDKVKRKADGMPSNLDKKDLEQIKKAKGE